MKVGDRKAILIDHLRTTLKWVASEAIADPSEFFTLVGTSNLTSPNRDLGDKSEDFVSGTDVLVYT